MSVYINTFRTHLFNYAQETDYRTLCARLDELQWYSAYARPKSVRYATLVYKVSRGGNAVFDYAKLIQGSEIIHEGDFSYSELLTIGEKLKIPEYTQNMYLLGYFNTDMKFILGEVRFSKENNLYHGLHLPLIDPQIIPEDSLVKYDYKSPAMVATNATNYNHDVLFVPDRNWDQAILYKTY